MKKSHTTWILLLTVIVSIPYTNQLAAQEYARMSDSFVESIGINTKLAYSDTPYAQFDSVKRMLLDAGIRYYRDEITTNTDILLKQDNLANAGIKLLALIHPDKYKNQDTLIENGLDILLSQYDVEKTLTGIENPNETDIWPITYKGLKHPQSIVEYSKDLAVAVKKSRWPNLTVLGPSYSNPWNYNDIKNSFGDFNNIHPYQGARMPENTEDGQSLPFYLKRVNVIIPDKKVWATETGNYTTTLPDKNLWFTNVSELVQAKYTLRTYLAYYKAGVIKTYVHMLVDYYNGDDWCEARFGICRSDWSPKPAYTGLKNLIGLLNDPGPEFTPNSLNYSLKGKTSGVNHLLLQNRQGTFFLILWRQVSGWDYNSAKEIAVDPINISVVFEKEIKGAKVYIPLNSDTILTNYGETDSIAVQVPDHPLVIQIEPALLSGLSSMNIENESVTVCPNPVISDNFMIQLPDRANYINYVADLFDANGKLVFSSQLNSRQNFIKDVHLKSGMYIINVKGLGYSSRGKFIVR